MEDQFPTTTRRKFLAAGGIGAAMALAMPSHGVADALSDQEEANVKVVNDFCAAWSTRSAEKIGEYLTEDAVFRMIETAPRTEGRETIVASFSRFLSTAESAEFKVMRTHALGAIVINERMDIFKTAQGERSFHVVGVFFVKDGKIAEWYDFSMPDAG